MSRHVVVLAGGLSHERDVSLRSGSRLYESLRGLGMEVTLRDVDSDLIPWLVETKPDAAIIALHGGRGENGAGALIDSLVGYLGLPLMVKPQHGGSALGASVVRSAEELPPALVGAFAYGDLVVVEVFVEGVELAITVIEEADGARALPAVEIAPSSGIFDYESRYTAGLTTYFTPARLSDEVAAAAADLAIGAHRVLGLRDVSRTDAIAAPDGTVHFLS